MDKILKNNLFQASIFKKARTNARMTQMMLAIAADISVKTVVRAENGKNISYEVSRALCSVLDLSLKDLEASSKLININNQTNDQKNNIVDNNQIKNQTDKKSLILYTQDIVILSCLIQNKTSLPLWMFTRKNQALDRLKKMNLIYIDYSIQTDSFQVFITNDGKMQYVHYCEQYLKGKDIQLSLLNKTILKLTILEQRTITSNWFETYTTEILTLIFITLFLTTIYFIARLFFHTYFNIANGLIVGAFFFGIILAFKGLIILKDKVNSN